MAHYLFNCDKSNGKHYIGSMTEDATSVLIPEGNWLEFSRNEIYENTKNKNKSSYFWDAFIKSTCTNALNGITTGNADLFSKDSAIFEMVKESRFMRRVISEKLIDAIRSFPEKDEFTRKVSFLPSSVEATAYVFLQIRAPAHIKASSDYFQMRQAILEIACGAAKNKFITPTKIVGIGMDALKFPDASPSQDYILLKCDTWTESNARHYHELNKTWRFFETKSLRQSKETVTEFVHKIKPKLPKVGRNELCPCGSSAKFKRCHGKYG